MLKGLDIASYQKDPDFVKVKAKYQFIITKVTENVNYTNPNFARSKAECRRLGILLGYYHFAKPSAGNTPEAEADYFLKQLGDIQPGECIFLDYEDNYADCVNWCKKWLDYIFAKTGIKAPIYLNKSLVKNFNWKPIIDAGYGLWLADYSYNPDSPVPAVPWALCAFRQYSNKEVVDGISVVTDANVFYGDETAFKAYGYKGNVQTDPCAELQEKYNKLAEEIVGVRESRDEWKKKSKDQEKVIKDYKTATETDKQTDQKFLDDLVTILNVIPTPTTREEYLVALKAKLDALTTPPTNVPESDALQKLKDWISKVFGGLLNK
jgi:lysozyme